jgi:DNA modification methylase
MNNVVSNLSIVSLARLVVVWKVNTLTVKKGHNSVQVRNYKTIKVADLIKFTANSRTHSPEQIQQIANSINEFGFTNPLLVDEHNIIIAGHGRLEAARVLSMDEVPCVIVDGLSEVQKSALVIADNKLALNAGWNMDVLRNEFEFLRQHDFNLELTGFSIEELCEFLPDEMPEMFCGDDDLPCDKPPGRATLGDVWLLGSHRLLCGDSTVPEHVSLLLAGQSPNTMVTDPPYGVKLDMSWRDKARGGNNNKNTVKNDDRADWLESYALFPGSIAYVWHASAFSDVVMANLRDAGFETKQQIIWRKNHFVLGRSNYHWQHEPCWYAIKKGAKSNWKGDRKQTTVWDCESPNASNSGTKDDQTPHPTQKPVELFVKSIVHHTNPGEYVYDPFAGSGTLMVACEKTKRRALMMELDPNYCDIIIQRYENYSGQKAQLEV